MYGETTEVVVFSPNCGCTVDVYCRKYTVAHWRAWQSSWATSLVLRRLRWHPGDSSGHHGGRCGGYRPPCLTCRRLEGSTGGGLALVKTRAAFEGYAHTYREFCRRVSTKGVQGVGSTVAGAVLGTSAQGIAGSHSVATVPGMAEQ